MDSGARQLADRNVWRRLDGEVSRCVFCVPLLCLRFSQYPPHSLILRFLWVSVSGQSLTIRLRSTLPGPQSAPGATILTILTPARPTAITAPTGSLAASSSAPARGTPAGMDARGAGAGVIHGAAGVGARTAITAADTDTTAATTPAITTDTITALTMAAIATAELMEPHTHHPPAASTAIAAATVMVAPTATHRSMEETAPSE